MNEKCQPNEGLLRALSSIDLIIWNGAATESIVFTVFFLSFIFLFACNYDELKKNSDNVIEAMQKRTENMAHNYLASRQHDVSRRRFLCGATEGKLFWLNGNDKRTSLCLFII